MKKYLFLAIALFLSIGTAAADYEHYSEWMTYSEIKRVPHPYNLDFSPNSPRWSYQVGIELDGMLDVFTTYGGDKLEKYLKEYSKKMIDTKGNITGYKYDDFNLDNATENALFADMPMICHAAPSRLALELEKILQSCYGDKHLQVFHDYGLLKYLLPEIDSVWGSDVASYMMKLFFERNCRVDEGRYRNSISLAIATIATAFVESVCGRAPGELWPDTPEGRTAVRAVVDKIFRPQNMMAKMNMSAERILMLQPELENSTLRRTLPQQLSYAHACELYAIRHIVAGEPESQLRQFPPPEEIREPDGRGRRRNKRKERR